MSETNMQAFTVDPNEPAVHNPALMPFVEAARRQTPPPLKVDVTSISQAWAQRRANKRRTLAVAVAAGLGALALGGLYGNRSSEPDAAPSRAGVPAVAKAPEAAPQAPEAEDGAEAEGVVAPVVPAVEPMRLADAVRLTGAPDEPAPEYRIDGPYEVTLARGAAVVSVDDPAQPLLVHVPDGALEIHAGVTQVVVAGDVSRVAVVEGTVFRITRDGTRQQLSPTVATAKKGPTLGEDPGELDGPTAEQLAEKAEQRLTAGDRKGAIKYLDQLVRKYPRSGAARTGLLDLARLLKADGQKSEARCAYQEFLRRHPRSPVTSEVERALDKLGEGQCRGLKPR